MYFRLWKLLLHCTDCTDTSNHCIHSLQLHFCPDWMTFLCYAVKLSFTLLKKSCRTYLEHFYIPILWYLPADQHCSHYRCPTCVQNLTSVLVILGNPHPKRCHKDKTRNDQGSEPVLFSWNNHSPNIAVTVLKFCKDFFFLLWCKKHNFDNTIQHNSCMAGNHNILPLWIQSNCSKACVYHHHTFAVHSLFAQFYKQYYVITEPSCIGRVKQTRLYRKHHQMIRYWLSTMNSDVITACMKWVSWKCLYFSGKGKMLRCASTTVHRPRGYVCLK